MNQLVLFVIIRLCKHVKHFLDGVKNDKQAISYNLKKKNQIQVHNELHT